MPGVTIELPDGRSFEISPFKIGALRRAAPHIDAINANVTRANELRKAGELPGLSDLGELMHELLAVLVVGISRIDASVTIEQLEDLVDLSFLQSLQAAVFAVMAASGLAPKGEAKPSLSLPATEAGADLEIGSEQSSQS
jgi:hypothetical protein